MNWRTSGQTLIVDGHSVAEFPFPVAQAREIDDTIVVVLDVPAHLTFPENAYGFVRPHRELWQLEPHAYYHTAAPDVRVSGISCEHSRGTVTLFTWSGVTLSVDLSNGHILSRRDAK